MTEKPKIPKMPSRESVTDHEKGIASMLALSMLAIFVISFCVLKYKQGRRRSQSANIGTTDMIEMTGWSGDG